MIRPSAIRASLLLGATLSLAIAPGRAAGQARAAACDADNAGLTLPPGFCASVFATGLGAPRHMAVAPNGDVLVVANRTTIGAESGGGAPGGALLLMRPDATTGKAASTIRLASGGGSGIALAGGYVYATSGRAIVRYKYAPGATVLYTPDTVVSDFLFPGHTAYNFVIVGTTLYMNVGSRTNACQTPETDRKGKAPGVDPCVELETRAGIWAFDVNRTNQKPADGRRFATGMRNSVSLTVNPKDNTLWATMHGRDQLSDWGFSTEYNAENPGEQVNHILAGDDFGWPYCYFSTEEKKLVTAPEYGGDGKQSSRCGEKKQPEYVFPGHWAPNDMLFYSGTQFPAEYRDGAFIAFHGSWNRAPLPQQGFRVVFLPMKGGKASAHRDFALDFSNNGGPGKDGKVHRPTGLAQGPDGTMYIADDVGGTVYRVWYTGKK
jgi:glucose/arabinose dehydrogenase